MTVQVVLSFDSATLALVQQFVATLSPQPNPQLDRIEAAIAQLSKEDTQIMADLTALTAEVTRNTTVEKSALVLIQGFAAQLAAAGTDPVKLGALQASLKANDDELAAAVAANTTPAPAPAPA
jgi:hypothetical protein